MDVVHIWQEKLPKIAMTTNIKVSISALGWLEGDHLDLDAGGIRIKYLNPNRLRKFISRPALSFNVTDSYNNIF